MSPTSPGEGGGEGQWAEWAVGLAPPACVPGQVLGGGAKGGTCFPLLRLEKASELKETEPWGWGGNGSGEEGPVGWGCGGMRDAGCRMREPGQHGLCQT